MTFSSYIFCTATIQFQGTVHHCTHAPPARTYQARRFQPTRTNLDSSLPASEDHHCWYTKTVIRVTTIAKMLLLITMQIVFLLLTIVSMLSTVVTGTSMKIDFLPLGNVRTDPIINPDCLSDHVHTFYGANKLRPETSYEDL